jgi:hypothetical protein
MLGEAVAGALSADATTSEVALAATDRRGRAVEVTVRVMPLHNPRREQFGALILMTPAWSPVA